jgi:hypothetical protein
VSYLLTSLRSFCVAILLMNSSILSTEIIISWIPNDTNMGKLNLYLSFWFSSAMSIILDMYVLAKTGPVYYNGSS